MAGDLIEVKMTPPDLPRRLQAAPRKLDAINRKTMEASLLYVQGEIPGYPKAPPDVDDSRRTGTLGRRLGVSQGGGVLGKPEIHLIKRMGQGAYEGRLGTSLWYADRVIGNQEQPWSRYWWTLTGIARKATDGVRRLHAAAMDELARFIDGG